mgnify:CR=1 FL=1
MPEYKPKSSGTTYLRFAINKIKSNPKNKYITIPLSKAQEIMEEAKNYTPSASGLVKHNNSVRASALMLGISVEELIKRMEAPLGSKVNSDKAEFRTKISTLIKAGDAIVANVKDKSHPLVIDWENAKRL